MSEVIQLKLRNVMEEIVDEMMNKMEFKEKCMCEICKLDIKALALNQLPTKYVVTKKGEAYSKTDQIQQQFKVDVTMALAKAANKVHSNPRHGSNPID